MDVREFIRIWSDSELRERQGAQAHFIDLCRVLGQKTPPEADPKGEWYCFEKGATKQGGGDGWADVWRKGCFAWEYKGKNKDLGAAYDQLLRYRESLESPPLLVVSDMERFQIHTNFTGTPKVVHEFALADLADKGTRDKLLALFESPESLRPGRRVEEVTEDAAAEFASLAEGLRSRGTDPKRGAHFLNRILFCLFAEDTGLLPRGLFAEIVQASGRDPTAFTEMLRELFAAMVKGGRFGTKTIHYFDGGLFADAEVIALEREEIAILDRVARLDWSQIEPAIFGTLFERGLDPSKRSQLGAHYTDRDSILRVIDPVLMAPLRREWGVTRTRVDELLAKAQAAKSAGAATAARNQAAKAIESFRANHLDKTVVLDPACGSGNFLYVALQRLHELEKEVLLKLAEVQKGQASLDVRVGPHMVKGIEINAYAHELAQVTIWIGHLQWHVKNGFGFQTNPVLKPIEAIECRDAILVRAAEGVPGEARWPEATVVVGNPPFLGGKRLRDGLGDNYVEGLFSVYEGRVPREADLVTYWFEKARAAIEGGRTRRAGLLGTTSIRKGASRRVLDRVCGSGRIFMAWDDEPWVVEGAAVRISLVGFDNGTETDIRLDGQSVAAIHSDLTIGGAGGGVDVTAARRLRENLGIAFMGDTKGGPFDVTIDVARRWLALPPNPNGQPNSAVVRPWCNAMDITRRPRDMWIIDFGVDAREAEAALFEAPFEHVRQEVRPTRVANRRASYREKWWIHVEPRPAMRGALASLQRYVVTPRVARHRTFVWLGREVLADSRLFAFARDDDYFFGILHSRFHEVWSLRTGSRHGVGNDPVYNATTCFETFAFPEPTEAQRQAIAKAAAVLNRQREAWLNPEGASAKELKRRTLTNLYNERPAWLDNAHRDLDAAVAAAYGWDPGISDDEVLAKLLELNLAREPA